MGNYSVTRNDDCNLVDNDGCRKCEAIVSIDDDDGEDAHDYSWLHFSF